MIKEDLVAERIAIDSYRDIIKYLGDQDPTTRRMMEGILAVEEEHADDLADLLVAFPDAVRRQDQVHEVEVSVPPRARRDAHDVTAIRLRAMKPARQLSLVRTG